MKLADRLKMPRTFETFRVWRLLDRKIGGAIAFVFEAQNVIPNVSRRTIDIVENEQKNLTETIRAWCNREQSEAEDSFGNRRTIKADHGDTFINYGKSEVCIES